MRQSQITARLFLPLAVAGLMLAVVSLPVPAPAQDSLKRQELEHLKERIERARREQRRLEPAPNAASASWRNGAAPSCSGFPPTAPPPPACWPPCKG